MRLAFLIYKYFPYGGLQRDFALIVSELQRRGHDCRVFCTGWQGETLPAVELRIAPAATGSNVRRNEHFLRWVQENLAAEPAEGVIGFNKMPGLDVYYAGDPCFIDKALRTKGPLYRLGWRFRHFAAWEKAVFDPAGTTRILLLSASEQRRFERHYHTPPERLYLLPPGVTPDRRRPPDAGSRRAVARHGLGLAYDVHTLLFVGSGFITKGLDRVIRALSALRATRPALKLRLLVAGQDRVGRFALMARRHQLQEQVTFLGGRDDVPELMLAADVLVHPARSEAAGIVLLEALVAGLPVVTTAACGYADHIAACGGGLVLAEPFDQAALDAALVRTLERPFLQQCRENGLAYAAVEDLYSLHSTAADMIEQALRRPRDEAHV